MLRHLQREGSCTPPLSRQSEGDDGTRFGASISSAFAIAVGVEIASWSRNALREPLQQSLSRHFTAPLTDISCVSNRRRPMPDRIDRQSTLVRLTAVPRRSGKDPGGLTTAASLLISVPGICECSHAGVLRISPPFVSTCEEAYLARCRHYFN